MQNIINKSRSVRLLLGVCAVSSVSVSMPAFADPVPAAAPTFSWSGPYVGVNIGKTTGESTWNGPAGQGIFGGNDQDTIHDRSVTYGGQIGYNYQLPHGLVIGIEGTLHGSSQSSGNSYTGGEGYSGLNSIAVRTHFGGDVSARFGAAFDHLLVYGKAGYAADHYDYTAFNDNDVVYTASQTRSGFLIGGGAEFALTRHWSIKGEYNHIGYTTKVITLTAGDGTTGTPPIGETANTFKFGVNYRF